MIKTTIDSPRKELKETSLADVCSRARECTDCELGKTRTQVVFGHGVEPCDVMAIGEAPGRDEDEQGIPFIGRSGQLLTKMLESNGLTRPDKIYITNTVKCRPPENRNPKPEEISACNHFLLAQIYHVKPKVLLLIGMPSMKTILSPGLGITKVRGDWYDMGVSYQKEPLKVMVLLHPAYLLRNASNEKGKPKWLTSQDLKKVKAYLK
jgi:uracil-DNA glycosylase